MNAEYEYYDVQPFSSLSEMMDLAVRDAGEKIAYKFKEHEQIQEVTFSEFVNTVFCLGSFLHQKKLSDKHIACIGDNSYKWITAYFTVLRSRGVFVPLDKELPVKSLLYLLNESDAVAVFCDNEHAEIFRRYSDDLKNIKYFIVFDKDKHDGKFISYDLALKEGSELNPEAFLNQTSHPDDNKLLVYTSGTTGGSKGVMLSEKNIVSSVYYGLMVSTVYDTGLSILPYHHTYEAVSDILVSFHHHSTLCINESLSAIMKNMVIYKPSYIYVVPAIAESIYKRIIRNIRKKEMEIQFLSAVEKSNELRSQGIDKRREFFGFIHESFGSRLIKIVCGGAPVRPEVAKFFDEVGFDFINGYGITECSPLVCVNHDKFNNMNTVGIRLPCIEWRIDNPDKNGIGEICVKGDIVMKCYYKQPQLTAQVIKDGWFYTGDYGHINEQEQLTICGRKKNIIVLSNGKNVYPEEIEEYIKDLDYVNEVVVRSEKDLYGNEKHLTAEVYLVEKKSPDEILLDIKKVCSDLPQYKQVSKVIVREHEFPKTASKKIIRC